MYHSGLPKALILPKQKPEKRKKGKVYAGDPNWTNDVKVLGSNYKMGATIILKCTKCGGFMLAAKGQKTKICPYCGINVNLLYAQKVASANTAMEASEILKNMKKEKGFTKT